MRLVTISGLPDHQFEAFAAHHLDQDGKLQLPSSQHLERIGAAGVLNAQGNVGQQFFRQPIAQIARGDVVAFASGERRSVDREHHRDGRLVDHDGRQRRGILGVGDGLTDRDSFYARDRNDVSEFGFRNIHALQAGEGKQLGDLGLLERAIALGDADFFSGPHRAVEHARNGQASEIVAVVQVRDQNLQRPVRIALRWRNGLHDRIKQRLEVLSAAFHVGR